MDLNLGAAERIEGCDFSLLTDKKISVLNARNNDCMQELLEDTGIIFACIWCCIKPQADKLEIDQNEFKERINGEVLIAGKEVWWDEVSDFFPDLKTALSKIIEGYKRSSKKINKRLEKVAKTVTDDMDARIDKAMDKAEREAMKTVGETFG